MKILGKDFRVLENFDGNITVPDCLVVPKNKLGGGHGEAKLYIASKDEMRSFFGPEGFSVTCFVLKEDLRQYMNAIKPEYFNPTLDYKGKNELRNLWRDRMTIIDSLEEMVMFEVHDQTQIEGPRGYVNSSDLGYQLIRELSLPLVSYISVLKLSGSGSVPLYYWKLFVDYDALDVENALVFKYGRKQDEPIIIPQPSKRNKRDEEIGRARVGQGKYREALLEECPFCPITMINDERLLIASHIKPWAVSSDKEKTDPHNGYMLSPLYDRLFDRGLITFTDDRKMLVSNWISPKNVQRMGLEDGRFYQSLPTGEERLRYLEYHRECVFKG
jgi:hypothetical protein